MVFIIIKNMDINNFTVSDLTKVVSMFKNVEKKDKYETPLSGWDPEKELWLCPVTLAVLGQHPEYIYIKKI